MCHQSYPIKASVSDAFARKGGLRGRSATRGSRSVGGFLLMGVFLASALPTGTALAQAPQDVILDPYKAHVRIGSVGRDSQARRVDLPLGKSVIVSVPKDIRDVLVSGPDTVDAILRGPRTVYLTGIAIGQASVFLFDREGRQVLMLDANVSRDVLPLRSALRQTLPESRLTVQNLGRQVLLGGVADSPASAKLAMDVAETYVTNGSVVNAMTIASGQQVLLKVKVAEIERTVIRQLGLGATLSGALGSVNLNLALPALFSASGASGTKPRLTATGSSGGANYGVNLDALERSGVFRTLAEPNLTTVSGQEAEFLAGGEYPYPFVGVDNIISVLFKPYGVSLAFKPVVLSNGRISLQIGTEVSDLNFNQSISSGTGTTGFTVPSLRIRRASTTVEVASGSSMMMAGLLQDRLRQSLDGAPWLKDIPILGALFRSRDYIDEATELVVIVTPYLVEGTQEGGLAAPTDNYTPSNELSALFFGRLNEAYEPPAPPEGQYVGEVGFIVE